ncbi:hypothetical protein DFH08DRAFT_153352 [Mycena albidolilacea]|uniref:Uncharacterized protein n=1 Tax=Mycena albidolilacea TaxID=1033008 RepID=A0AAD7A1Q0_9AGAR|nr:hypothetical protein DFH08DRAFT_153352 [Mycena albidolilacea]
MFLTAFCNPSAGSLGLPPLSRRTQRIYCIQRNSIRCAVFPLTQLPTDRVISHFSNGPSNANSPAFGSQGSQPRPTNLYLRIPRPSTTLTFNSPFTTHFRPYPKLPSFPSMFTAPQRDLHCRSLTKLRSKRSIIAPNIPIMSTFQNCCDKHDALWSEFAI